MSVVHSWSEELLGTPDRWPGEVGERLRYHLAEHARQASIEPIELATWDAMGIDARSRVLDVGCGAGQTLRLLGAVKRAHFTGVDADADALALGARLSPEIRFVHGDVHRLPFGDGSFTHVVSRDMLTFVHQRRALAEMRRVLAPGGSLYLYVEGPAFDLRLLREAKSARAAVCRLRDFAHGVALHLTGRQLTPRGRAFATHARLSKMLRGLGYEIVDSRVGGRRRFPAKIELVARARA